MYPQNSPPQTSPAARSGDSLTPTEGSQQSVPLSSLARSTHRCQYAKATVTQLSPNNSVDALDLNPVLTLLPVCGCCHSHHHRSTVPTSLISPPTNASPTGHSFCHRWNCKSLQPDTLARPQNSNRFLLPHVKRPAAAAVLLPDHPVAPLSSAAAAARSHLCYWRCC